MFPSSFSIEAALGNLRISDDSLSSSHMYYWACDMRNPGGSSFVEVLPLSNAKLALSCETTFCSFFSGLSLICDFSFYL